MGACAMNMPPRSGLTLLLLFVCQCIGVFGQQRVLQARFQHSTLPVGTNNSLDLLVTFSDGFPDRNFPPSAVTITIHHLASDVVSTVTTQVVDGSAQHQINITLAGTVVAFAEIPSAGILSSNTTTIFTATEAVELSVGGATEAVVLVPSPGRIRSPSDADVAAVTLTTRDQFGNPTSLRPLEVQVVLTVRNPPTAVAPVGDPFFWASPWSPTPPYTPADALQSVVVSGSVTIMVTGFFTRTVDISFANSNDTRLDISSGHTVIFVPAVYDHVAFSYKGTTADTGVTLPTGTVDETFAIALHLEDPNNNIATQTNSTISVTTTTPQGVNTTRTVAIVNGIGLLSVQFTLVGSAIFDVVGEVFRNNVETVSLTIEPGVAVSYALLNPTDGDPTDPTQPGSADNNFVIFVEAQDQFGNVAVTEERDVSILVLQGSSNVAFVTGSPVVAITNGRGQSTMRDTTAETIVLGLADTSATGLDTTSTQDMVVVWGAAVAIFIRPVADGVLRTRLAVNLEIRDSNDNAAQSRSENVTLRVTGSATPATQLIVLTNGVGSGEILDAVEENVTLSLENPTDPTLSVVSTRIVSFTPDPIPPFIVATADPNTTLVDTTVTIRAIVRIGSQPLFAAEDVISTATLQVTDPLGSVSMLPMTVSRGVSTINFDNQLAGLYSFQVLAPANSGVLNSDVVNVTLVAELPATFLLRVVPNGHPTPLTPTVNQSMLFVIDVQDRFGNPTDAAELNVTATVVNTIHPTEPSLVAQVSPVLPTPNPLVLFFGNGSIGTFNVQLVVAEIAEISMSLPFPTAIDVSNTVNLTFLPAAPSLIYFLPIANGTVDDSYTFGLILGDPFLNRVYAMNTTVNVSVHDSALGTSTVTVVDITRGHGTLSLSRTLPTVVTVSLLPHAAGYDTSDSSVISISPGAAVRYVLIDPVDGDPTDPTQPGSTDNTFVVSVEARDQHDNIASGENRDVSITVRSGSAAFFSGSPTVDIVSGVGQTVMLDTVAETVVLGLFDSAATGLDVTSVQDVIIYWGAPFSFNIEPPNPAVIAVGQFSLVTVTVRDQGGNLNPTENRDVSVVTNGTGSFSSVIGASDPIELVVIVNGTGSLHVTASSVGVIRLSLVDTEATGLRALATQTASFVLPVDLVTRNDSRNIVLQLSNDELNRVKAVIDLATSRNDTFLCNDAGTMTDIAGNPLALTSTAIQATQFGPDIDPPTLNSFDLTMVNGVPPMLLTLSFSESVNVSTLNPLGFVFRSSTSNATFTHRLAFTQRQLNSGISPFSSEFADVVQITLSEDDRLAIEAQHAIGAAGSIGTGLARRRNDSFLSVDVDSVRDMVGLALHPISPELALQVSQHTVDLVKPIISSFDLNLNSGELGLTFSEVVNVSTFNVTQISFAGHNPYTLTGGSYSNNATSSVIVVTFLDADLDEIKSRLPGMASSTVTSALTVTADFIRDIATNMAPPLFPSDPLLASAYVADTTDAQLVSFDVDMNISTLTLTFSEVINGSSINVSQIILQNSASATPTASYALTTSTTDSGPSRIQTVTFSVADTVAIKNNVNLATSANTTFLFLVPRFEQLFIPVATDLTRPDILDGNLTVQGGQIASTLAQDMSGNLISGILPGSALPVRVYTGDVLSPDIERFEVNFDSGEIDFTFTEPVNVSAMRAASISFSSSNVSSTAVSISLTGGTSISLSSTRLVKLFLTHTDLNALKAAPVCTAALLGSDCYLSHDQSLVTDSAGVSVSLRSVANGLLPAVYTADTTVPSVVPEGFQSFNLNTGQIVISFSETVNESSFLIDSVGVQTSFAPPNPSVGLFRHVFSGGIVTTNAPSDTVTFNITQADLDAIRVNARLCSVPSQCFLFIQGGAVTDMAALPNSIIPTALPQDGRVVQALVADTVRPSLVSYSLDLDTHQLTMTFSEAVLPATIRATSLVFHDLSGSNSYRLSSGVSTSAPGPVIVFDFSTVDANAIKARQLAVDSTTTRLSFSEDFIVDTAFAPNNVTSVSLLTPLSYSPDRTSPQVLSFSIDMNRQFGRLSLTFNEPVLPTLVSPTGLTFQSERVFVSGSTSEYTLTGGALAASSDLSPTAFVFAQDSMDLDLTAADTTALKTNFGLGQAPSNTFLRLTATTAIDSSGNPVQPILSSDALPVSAVGVDNLAAQLYNFSIDFDQKTITLLFDDVLDVSTLNVQAFKIQSTPTAHLGGGSGLHYNLQSSTTQSTDGYVIIIDMSPEDELALNRIAGLATARSNTFLTMTANAVDDIDGRDVIAVTTALQATAITLDSRSPTLTHFELDLTLETVTLYFSEALNTSVLLSASVWITSTSADDGSGSGLDSGFVPRSVIRLSENLAFTFSDNQTIAVLTLAASDVDALKLDDGIGTSVNNTFLFHSANLSVDMIGNTLVPISSTQAIAATTLTADSIPPVLSGFHVDMDTRNVYLTFTEPVRVSTIDPTQVQLAGAGSDRHTLTGGIGSVANGRVAVITLISVDFNAVGTLAMYTSLADSFLSTAVAAIQDMAGVNSSASISLQAATYIGDQSSPQLSDCIVNMNSRTITLFFSETVNHSQTTVSNVLVHGISGDTKVLNGTLGVISAFRAIDWPLQTTVPTTPGLSFTGLTIALTVDDFNKIASDTSILTNVNNSFCQVLANAVVDVSSNPNVVGDVQASAFAADGSAGQLQSMRVDLDRQLLWLTFTETVDVATFDPTAVTLQSAQTAPISVATMRQLTGALSIVGALNVLRFQLVTADFMALARGPGLFTNINTSFVTITATSIRDMAGNFISAVSNGNAVGATAFIDDATDPILQSFDVDMNSGQLTLSFSETVEILSLNSSRFTLSSQDLLLSRTLTSGSVAVGSNGAVIVVSLGLLDLNFIKRFAFANTNVGLSTVASAVFDRFGNGLVPVLSTARLFATILVPDTTPPTLEAFDIDLTTFLLTLSFSEIVNASTIDMAQVTLIGAANSATDNRTLVGGSINNSANLPSTCSGGQCTVDPFMMEFAVQLTPIDLDFIYRNTLLATSASDTFLSWGNGLVVDLFSANSATSRPFLTSPFGLPVRQYTDDQVPPTFRTFQLDMTSRILVVQFSETIDKQTVNLSQITLVNGAGVPTTRFSLTGGSVLHTERYPAVIDFEHFSKLTIALSTADVDEINRLDDLCTAAGSAVDHQCFITMSDQLLQDMNGNALTPVPLGVPVLAYTNDTISPQFVSFAAIDLTLGQVTVLFDETVRASTLDCRQITLHPSHFSESNFSFSDRCVMASQDGTSAVFNFSAADLNALKLLSSICVSDNTCYMRMTETAVQDMRGNNVVPVSVRSTFVAAEHAQSFVADAIAPTVVAFDANFDTRVLTLYFDETVDVSTLVQSSITFQGLANSTASDIHTLQSSAVTTLTNGLVANISISVADLGVLLAVSTLARNASSTYLTFTSALIQDMNGNSVAPRVNAVNALLVSQFTLSLRRPSLVAFESLDFSVNPGTMQLSFSDAVEIDTINFPSIRLQADVDGALGISTAFSPNNTASHIFSNGFTDKLQVVITFDLEFQRLLKLNYQLAISQGTSFLSIASTAFQTKHGGLVNEISAFSAMQVDNYVRDLSQPILVSSTLDMDQGVMTLSFNDVVDIATMDSTRIAFQGTAVIGDPLALFLTSITLPSQLDPQYAITVDLHPNGDLNRLKRFPRVGTSINNTVVVLQENAFLDANVPALSIIATTRRITTFIADRTPPRLDEYRVDMGSGTLFLSFSETVDVESLDLTQLRLQTVAGEVNGADSGSGGNAPAVVLSTDEFYTLTGGTVFGSDIQLTPNRTATYVSVNFTLFDFNELKCRFPLGSTANTTLLSLDSAFIQDMNSNLITSVLSTDPVPPLKISTVEPDFAGFTADTARPELINFRLNLNLALGQIILTFSDSVRSTAFDPTQVRIMSSADGSGTTFRLRGGTMLNGCGNIQAIELTVADFNAIKQATGLATNQSTTYISLPNTTVTDLYLNPLVAVVRQVDTYNDDLVRPEVASFDLDMNTATLHLVFSQAVDASTFDVTQITIRSSNSSFAVSHTLTGKRFQVNHTTIVPSTEISIGITLSDENALKAIDGLAKSTLSTFLNVTSSLVRDFSPPTAGNRLLPPIVPIQVSVFVADTTVPTVSAFDLDMNSLTLTVFMSETVNVSSVQPHLISVQSQASVSAAETACVETGGPAVHPNGAIVDCFLLAQFGCDFDISHVYTSIPSGTVVSARCPCTCNSSSAVGSGDIGSGIAPEVRATSYSLTTSGLVTSVDSPVFTISLSAVDAHAIRATLALGADARTTFLSVAAAAIFDTATVANPVTEVSRLAALPVQTYTADVTRPQLVSFNFTMDIDATRLVPILPVTLSMEFTEPVLLSSVNMSGASIWDGATSYSNLTGSIVQNTVNSHVLQLLFTAVDLQSIRDVPNLATSQVSTVLELRPESLTDTNGNAVNFANQVPVTTYVGDLVRPVVLEFDVNMNDRSLTFFLSEPVTLTNIRLNTVQLQSESVFGQNSGSSSIGNGTIQGCSAYFDPRFVEGTLQCGNNVSGTTDGAADNFTTAGSFSAPDRLHHFTAPVRGLYNFSTCGSAFDTWIHVYQAHPNGSVGTQMFSCDDCSDCGTAAAASLTLDAGNYYVVVDGFRDQRGTYVLSTTCAAGVTSAPSTPATQGGCIGSSLFADVLRYSMTNEESTVLKVEERIFRNASTSYLSLIGAIPGTTDTLGLSQDLAENQVDAISATAALQARHLQRDIESPRLNSYNVDMTTGTILLTFSEAVDASTLQVSSFSFANDRTNPTEVFAFGAGQTSSTDGKILSFVLSQLDANGIRARTTLGTLRSNTVLGFSSSAVRDMYGNAVLPVVVGVNATLATVFTSDTLAPLLEQFSIDMNAGVITLVYDQVVNFTSVQPDQFSLYDASTTAAAVNYTLARGSFAQINSTAFQIILSLEDLNEIKRLPLCSASTGVAQCFIGFGPGSVFDLEGLPVLPLANGQTLPATQYVVDITPPTLVTTGFTELNLTSGLLTMSFSETVNISSFSLSGSVTLQTSFEVPDATQGLNSYQLTSVTMMNADHGPVVQLLLSAVDLNRVKQDSRLCTVQSNCYLALTSTFIADMSGVPLTSTTFDLPGRRVQSLVVDAVSPELVSVDLDLSLDQLRMSFSETVATGTNGASISFSGISLQSFSNRSTNPDRFFTLTGGIVSHDASSIVVIDLTSDDVLAIKARRVGTSVSDTYVSILSTTAHDTAFNPNFVRAIVPNQGLQAFSYVRDARQPRLTSFTVDMNRRLGLLSLTFNEPVDPASITTTGITFQSEQRFNSSTTVVHTLTGGSLTAATDLSPTDFVYATSILDVEMSEADTTTLKTNFGLSQVPANTFLRVIPAVVNDASGNPLQSIDGTNALQVSSVATDVLPARLVNFTINFESKTLALSFDDVMDVSSLNVAAIKIQSSTTAHLTGGAGLHYNLQSSSSTSPDGYDVIVDLSFDDELALNRILGLATARDNTYITLTANAINDIDSRDVLAVTTALLATQFIPDATPPTVVNVDMNLDSGELTLFFSEAINTSVFSSTALTLSNARDQCASNSVACTDSAIITADSGSGSASGDASTLWVDSAGRNCSFYTTQPDQCYIPVSSQSGSGMTATATCCACGGGIRCTAPVQIRLGGDTGVVFASDQTSVVVSMLDSDLDLIKLSDLIATSTGGLFVSHTSSLTSDMTGLPITPILGDVALAARTLIPDTTPPSLVAFAVDMTTQTIDLTFSEPVRISSVILSGANMGLRSNSSGGPETFNVASGGLIYTSSRTALFTLDLSEVFAIKLLDQLYTSVDTTYLHLSGDFILDMGANRLQDSGVVQATTFVADQTAPTLLTYLLNLNHGTLLLNFDEPVRANSANLGGTTSLLSAPSSSTFVALTGGAASANSLNGLQIVVNLTSTDLNEVKRLTGLATSQANTFISFTAGFVNDMAGVAVSPVTAVNAQQADSFINDITRPEIVSYGLNMAIEPAIITFTFQETVDISSLRLDRITLQQSFSTPVGDNSSHQLIGGTTLTSINGTVVSAQLTEHDYETLKLKGIGATPATTWLTSVDGFIADMSGVTNAVITTAVDSRNVDVAQFVSDTTSPRMQFFDVNLSSGIVDFYFSEPVSAASFDSTGITMQNVQAAP
eukprot:m.403424 g.403424  ORF g.403424 m.403424 type:complete len:6121 (+) comp16790_c1_seq2:183-18545(+)